MNTDLRLPKFSIENSPGSLVYQNDCKRMGDGITGFGSCPASTFACNVLWRCYNGFNFFNADIGDQVIDPNTAQPAPTGNVYTSSVNRDLTGAISPAVNWYESGGINEQMLSGSLLPSSDPQISPSASLCNTIYQLMPPPGIMRQLEAGLVIQSLQTNAALLSTEQQYLTRKYVHRKLRQNPQWLNLSTPQDTMYQNFYNQTNGANFGNFRTVEESAETDNQPVAQISNTAIICSGPMDHNLKIVTDIYAQTWMLGKFNLSSADSSTLHNIAVLNPCTEGPGVYSARAILGLSVDDITGYSTYRRAAQQVEKADSQPTVFPNPATNHITVELSLEEGEMGTIIIFDMNGRLVLSQSVNGASSNFKLDVSVLPEGIYMLRCIVNEESRLNEQLVIIK